MLAFVPRNCPTSDEPALGLIALGLRTSDAAALGLIELGFPIFEAAPLGFTALVPVPIPCADAGWAIPKAPSTVSTVKQRIDSPIIAISTPGAQASGGSTRRAVPGCSQSLG